LRDSRRCFAELNLPNVSFLAVVFDQLFFSETDNNNATVSHEYTLTPHRRWVSGKTSFPEKNRLVANFIKK
jgi:hypothetical protein